MGGWVAAGIRAACERGSTSGPRQEYLEDGGATRIEQRCVVPLKLRPRRRRRRRRLRGRRRGRRHRHRCDEGEQHHRVGWQSCPHNHRPGATFARAESWGSVVSRKPTISNSTLKRKKRRGWGQHRTTWAGVRPRIWRARVGGARRRVPPRRPSNLCLELRRPFYYRSYCAAKAGIELSNSYIFTTGLPQQGTPATPVFRGRSVVHSSGMDRVQRPQGGSQPPGKRRGEIGSYYILPFMFAP